MVKKQKMELNLLFYALQFFNGSGGRGHRRARATEDWKDGLNVGIVLWPNRLREEADGVVGTPKEAAGNLVAACRNRLREEAKVIVGTGCGKRTRGVRLRELGRREE